MKYCLLCIAVLLSGCAAKPPRLCYEMTLYLERTSKQVICTSTPQTETPDMKRIKK